MVVERDLPYSIANISTCAFFARSYSFQDIVYFVSRKFDLENIGEGRDVQYS